MASTHPQVSPRHRAAIAFLIAALSFAWFVWSTSWYERRYGFIKSHKPTASSGCISILHPQPSTGRTGNHSGVRAANLVLMALYLVPALFHRFDHRSGQFGLLVIIFCVLPRVDGDSYGLSWVRLRRILALLASILICAIYLCYLFARLEQWGYLAAVSASLLLLDLYDHWLFTRILVGSPAEIPLV